MQPVIGITIDYSTRPLYSHYPWYALRTNYSEAIEQRGGVPILLPYAHNQVSRYLDMIDGLIIAGGDFDIHPKFYHEEITTDTVVNTIDIRTTFELAMLAEAIKRQMPILGICGGMQLLNICCGGTLLQHIPNLPTPTNEHQQPHPKHIPFHSIKPIAQTKLATIVDSLEYMVNSTHHQAVSKIGRDIIVSAQASDGIIEAIELSTHPFCLGVQWHPEYCHISQDQALFTAFIEACRHYGQ